MRKFVTDSIKHIIMKVMSFHLRGCWKVYDKVLFLPVCISMQICTTVIGSMEIFKTRKFVMGVYRWRLEEGADYTAKKVSWFLDWGGIMSAKVRLSLAFDFGSVDELIVVSLTRWNFSLSVLYVVQMLLFFDRESEDKEVFFDFMADIFISRESMFFIWSDLISSIFFSFFVSS